jgi:hypothetical protein
VVRRLDGVECRASTLVRADSIDLALLAVAQATAQTVKLGRIDRDRIDVVRDVMAAGFPNYKYAHERPVALKRQPAQPIGSIPTVEDFSLAQLTLKIEYGEPAAPGEGEGSPWEGLSGAGVVVGDYLLGVAIEHHAAEGLSSLRVVPLTQLTQVEESERVVFCAVLGIDDPEQLPVVGLGDSAGDEVPAALVSELRQLTELSEAGLLGPGELKTLRITAVKEAKGWR